MRCPPSLPPRPPPSRQIINADDRRERAQLKAQLAQDLQQGWQRQVRQRTHSWGTSLG